MAHHGDESQIRRLQENLVREMGLGPTGKFPNGKLNDDDEGEITVAIAADKAKGVVVIDFGKPTAWIGFTPDQAVDIAEMLHAKARECRGIV